MARVRVPYPANDLGEVDVQAMVRVGRCVDQLGSHRYIGHAVDVDGGCLIFVPAIKVSDI